MMSMCQIEVSKLKGSCKRTTSPIYLGQEQMLWPLVEITCVEIVWLHVRAVFVRRFCYPFDSLIQVPLLRMKCTVQQLDIA